MKQGYHYMTDAEIYQFYQKLNKHDYKGCSKLFAGKDLFILMEGDGLFTNSVQGRGAFMFTDRERAANFLNKEENANFRCTIGTARLERILAMNCDIYFNATVPGDKTAFMLWNERTSTIGMSCKDREGHYAMPYGITPAWQRRGLFRRKSKNVRPEIPAR